MNRSLQKKNVPTTSTVGIKTDGRITAIAANGPAADFLAGIVGVCLLALTINAIAKS